jgi:hypothetical protein
MFLWIQKPVRRIKAQPLNYFSQLLKFETHLKMGEP